MKFTRFIEICVGMCTLMVASAGVYLLGQTKKIDSFISSPNTSIERAKAISKITPTATAADEIQSHFSRPSIDNSSHDISFSRAAIAISRAEESMRSFNRAQRLCAIVMTVFLAVLVCVLTVVLIWL